MNAPTIDQAIAAAGSTAEEDAIYRKVGWRVLPLLVVPSVTLPL